MPYFEVQLTQKMQRVYDIAHDMSIGRAPQCQIQLLSRAVSRRHARIEVGDQGEVIVSDLGTKNGIKLNGKRVQGAAIVHEGDKVIVGDVSMTFRAADRNIAPEDAIDLRRRAAGPSDLQAALRPTTSFLLPAREDVLQHFMAGIARGRISRLEFDELTRFKLQIALKEALDNARVHGSGNDPNRTIQVTFTENDDEFMISVKDEGPGYEVETKLAGAEEIDAMNAIRNRPALGTGLGLRIILNCVDRVQFEGSGALIHMGRFKDQGQIFVISEEGSDAHTATGSEDTEPLELQQGEPALERDELMVEESTDDMLDIKLPPPLRRSPPAQPHDETSEELQIGEEIGGEDGEIGPWDESEEQGPLKL